MKDGLEIDRDPGATCTNIFQNKDDMFEIRLFDLFFNMSMQIPHHYQPPHSHPHKSLKMFESIHYSAIQAIEKLNEEIFATSASDGIINIWNTRMNKLLTSISLAD